MIRSDGSHTASTPFIVTGMPHSGIAVAAAWLEECGVDLGSGSPGADRGDHEAHRSDSDFATLQDEMLRAALPACEPGLDGWGWVESAVPDPAALDSFTDRARQLVEARSGIARPWGWSDPRTCLVSSFWQELLPEARLLLVYRYPWEVAESLQQRGHEVFLRKPHLAYDLWLRYNREILACHQRAGGRALLLSHRAFQVAPERLAELAAQWDLQPGSPPRRQHPFPGRIELSDPLVDLELATHPTCEALLRQLEAAADVPGPALPPAEPRRWQAQPRDAAKVAIVVPCYNHGEFVVEAVASVARCVPEPHELVIVDDGSSEARTLAILDQLSSQGLTVVRQANSGVAAARNRGIASTSAPFILPLDADNRLMPGFVAAALSLLSEEPSVGVVYSDRFDFGLRNGRAWVPDFNLPSLLLCNYIDACAIYRREVWQQAGGYDVAMPRPGWEDWSLWLGAAEHGWAFRYLAFEGFEYRVRPGSMITSLSERSAQSENLDYLARKHARLFATKMSAMLAEHQLEKLRAWQERDEQAATIRRLEGELRDAVERVDSLALHLASAQQTTGSLRDGQAAERLSAAELRAQLDGQAATIAELHERLAVQASTIAALQEQLAIHTGAGAALREQLDLVRLEAARVDRELVSARGLTSQVPPMEDEIRVLHQQISVLHQEIERHAERIAFMSSTRAWRWRSRLLALRRLLQPGRSDQ